MGSVPGDAGQHIRPPAVAGMFYPADATALRREIGACLRAAGSQALSPKALIAPHAGYVYSGPVAASAYHLLEPHRDRIRRVVLLGPSHRVPLRGLALSRAVAFETPLGTVPLDPSAAKQLGDLPQVEVVDQAHTQEHSLEVHLPFLQEVLDSFTLVPLAVGDAGAPEVAEVLERLWGGDETLIVISSDLSHYLPYDLARTTDEATAANIERMEPVLHGEQACGCRAINGLLTLAACRKLSVTRLDLRNSGDTAGDRNAVVGYGAWAFA